MTNQNNFSHSATIFPVEDIEKSIQFYINQLGFEITFSWGEPVSYVVIKKGGVNIHLTKRLDDDGPSKQHCALYIFVYDLEIIYQRCLKEEVIIKNAPANRDYQMKDFDIIDPDGYIITFGNEQ